MGKSQREKGKRLEREVAEILRALFPDARRSANQAGGAIQPDIDDTPYWVEVSGGQKPSPHTKYEQAGHDTAVAHDERPIAVFTRRNRGKWLVTMSIDDWLDLVKEANDNDYNSSSTTSDAG